mmetsp:Transcript_7456/g.26636  ORF Transcript_7456/g.26636 Transcript_7456/m.26636 type:complete len:344 (-) Transcript_7456:501-1532(-)
MLSMCEKDCALTTFFLWSFSTCRFLRAILSFFVSSLPVSFASSRCSVRRRCITVLCSCSLRRNVACIVCSVSLSSRTSCSAWSRDRASDAADAFCPAIFVSSRRGYVTSQWNLCRSVTLRMRRRPLVALPSTTVSASSFMSRPFKRSNSAFSREKSPLSCSSFSSSCASCSRCSTARRRRAMPSRSVRRRRLPARMASTSASKRCALPRSRRVPTSIATSRSAVGATSSKREKADSLAFFSLICSAAVMPVVVVGALPGLTTPGLPASAMGGNAATIAPSDDVLVSMASMSTGPDLPFASSPAPCMAPKVSSALVVRRRSPLCGFSLKPSAIQGNCIHTQRRK